MRRRSLSRARLPAGTEHENNFTMLSDIFPTGYHGTELAQTGPGDTVAIVGARPRSD